MASTIEYHGHVITPASRHRRRPPGWTLEVQIAAANRSTGIRRCRAPNTYPSEAEAIAHCLEFGRRIVDGKLKPRPKSSN